MKNFHKTAAFTSGLSLISIIGASAVQLNSNNNLTNSCSYLDPMIIDILAFSGALFLIVEGICRILKEKNAPLKRQVTRAVRIAFGCAVITLHIIQIGYKL